MLKKNHIISLISRIRILANTYIFSELKKKNINNIEPTHGSIFYFLHENKKLTVTELANLTERKKATVSVLIDKLCKLGYLEKNRCDSDTRCFYINLTERGKKLTPIFDEISDELIELVFKDIPRKDIETTIKTLIKIKKNFQK